MPPKSKITFLRPSFKNPNESDDEGHVNIKIKVVNHHTLEKVPTANTVDVTAVASEGFPADIDGTYVFVTKIHANVPELRRFYSTDYLSVGFINKAKIPPSLRDRPFRLGHITSEVGYAGFGLHTFYGYREPMTWKVDDPYGDRGKQEHFPDPEKTTKVCKEIISVFTISNFGQKKTVYWIVDGVPCAVDDVTNDMKSDAKVEDEIYPAITLASDVSKVEMISFDAVTARSDAVNNLKLPFSGRLRNFFMAHAPYNVAKVDEIVKNVNPTEQAEYLKSLGVLFGIEDDFEEVFESAQQQVGGFSSITATNNQKQQTSSSSSSSSTTNQQQQHQDCSSKQDNERENLIRALQQQLALANTQLQRTEAAMKQQKEQFAQAQKQLQDAQKLCDDRVLTVQQELKSAQQQINKLLLLKEVK